MTHQFYLPGDVVYSHNQNKTIMVICIFLHSLITFSKSIKSLQNIALFIQVCVTSGVLELLSDEDDESPMISLAKGSCFGEISLVYNIPGIALF